MRVRFNQPCSACGDGDTAMRFHDHDHTAPTPSYTLAEIKELAKQWANERQISEYSRWQISELLAWLAKREQGKGDRDEHSSRQ